MSALPLEETNGSKSGSVNVLLPGKMFILNRNSRNGLTAQQNQIQRCMGCSWPVLVRTASHPKVEEAPKVSLHQHMGKLGSSGFWQGRECTGQRCYLEPGRMFGEWEWGPSVC